MLWFSLNLNTSHVKVNPIGLPRESTYATNLNTSHVKVNRELDDSDFRVCDGFKYISC